MSSDNGHPRRRSEDSEYPRAMKWAAAFIGTCLSMVAVAVAVALVYVAIISLYSVARWAT